MQAERWQRIQNIFDQALEYSAGERPAFLSEACGDDVELRKEVDDMLDVDDGLSLNYLETVVMGGSALLTETFDPILKRGTFGKYKILEKVGEGGFGMVHRGVDQDLKRDVAIKTCTSSDERLRLRFQREAEISARLQHPNITTVYDLGIEDGIPYLVQEFLIGEDLSDKIERKEPLDTSTRLDYLLQIARGLAHAHKHGVLHRDVKPGNMRVLDNGRLKLLDFGIARLVDERNPITTEGVAVGTVGYLSPEQFEGTGVDRRSDIFSFGVVAYELLTQVRPFPGKTFSEVSYKLMYEAPQLMGELWPDCPVALEHLVSRCLEKEQDKRYQSINELIPDLEEVIQQLQDDHQGKTALITVGQEVERRQRNRWVIMAAGLVGLFALLIVGTFFGGRETPPKTSQIAERNDPLATTEDLTTDLPTTPTQPSSTSPNVASSTTPSSTESTADDPPEDGSSPEDGPPSEDDPLSEDNSPTEVSLLSEDQAGAQTATVDPVSFSAEADLKQSSEVGAMAPGPEPPPTEPAASESTQLEDDTSLPLEPSSQATLANLDESSSNPTAEILQTSQDNTSTAESGTPVGVALPNVPVEEVALPEPAETKAPFAREPVVVEPELVQGGPPRYPPNAYRLKLEATVTLLVRIDETGKVKEVTRKSSNTPKTEFEDAAEKAVRKSRFRPGTVDGVAKSMWKTMSWDFKYQ